MKLFKKFLEENSIGPSGELTSTVYICGHLLGSGASAQVYQLTSMDSKHSSAVKFIPKRSLTSSRSLKDLDSEISLHSSVHHPNIVSFEHYFEDPDNIYIFLELCVNGSLRDLLRRRTRLLELEAQCYLRQLLSAISYLHALHIVHRDIKLNNLLLNDRMELKLGDFGMACRIEFEGQRKRTVCGTPNYIAPEVLDGRVGHSFEADVWSFGVVAFTMIVGEAPFSAESSEEIYSNVRKGHFEFPDSCVVSDEAKDLIERLLRKNPGERLKLVEVANHSFFSKNRIPDRLPVSTLCAAPSNSYLKHYGCLVLDDRPDHSNPSSPKHELLVNGSNGFSPREMKLSPVISPNSKLSVKSSKIRVEKSQIWVKRWVDLGEQHGLGYKLSTGLVGTIFDDSSQLMYAENKAAMYLVAGQRTGKRFLIEDSPEELKEKVRLFRVFEKKLNFERSECINYEFFLERFHLGLGLSVFLLSDGSIHAIFDSSKEILLQSQGTEIIYMCNDTTQRVAYSEFASSENSDLIEAMRELSETLRVMGIHSFL